MAEELKLQHDVKRVAQSNEEIEAKDPTTHSNNYNAMKGIAETALGDASLTSAFSSISNTDGSEVTARNTINQRLNENFYIEHITKDWTEYIRFWQKEWKNLKIIWDFTVENFNTEMLKFLKELLNEKNNALNETVLTMNLSEVAGTTKADLEAFKKEIGITSTEWEKKPRYQAISDGREKFTWFFTTKDSKTWKPIWASLIGTFVWFMWLISKDYSGDEGIKRKAEWASTLWIDANTVLSEPELQKYATLVNTPNPTPEAPKTTTDAAPIASAEKKTEAPGAAPIAATTTTPAASGEVKG